MADQGDLASWESQVLELARHYLPQGVSDADIIKKFPDMPQQTRVAVYNSLIEKHRFNPCEDSSGTPVFKFVEQEEAQRFQGLGAQEMLVYQQIRDSGNNGIWNRDLKIRTSLPQQQIGKIVKTLENRQLIKPFTSAQAGKKKVFLLFELEPSKAISGGAWFSNGDFDEEFFRITYTAAHRWFQQHPTLTVSEVGRGSVPGHDITLRSSITSSEVRT